MAIFPTSPRGKKRSHLYWRELNGYKAQSPLPESSVEIPPKETQVPPLESSLDIVGDVIDPRNFSRAPARFCNLIVRSTLCRPKKKKKGTLSWGLGFFFGPVKKHATTRHNARAV